MKAKLSFLTAIVGLLFTGFAWAQQVQVGNGTEVNTHLPIEPFYNYSYTQQIYLASEIGDNDGGTITEIKFYYHGSNGIASSNEWTVYIGHTTKTEFSSTSDWVDVSTLTQVFSGNIGSVTADGWVTIDITDWNYNGTDNIIVAVDENQSGYDGSGDDFYATSVADNRALEYHSDSSNPDPASPPAGNLKTYIPNIIFVGLQASCPAPANATASATSASEATLSWDANGGSQWEIEWGNAGFSQGSGTTVSGITQPTYQLTGLSEGLYEYYVRADCGGGTYSSWLGPIAWTQPYANDTCGQAMTLTVYDAGAGAGNEVTQNTTYATASSMSHTSCDSYGTNYDLFYSFTAPASGAVKIITGGDGGSSIEAAVYDGCGGNEIECFSSSSTKTVQGLTAGDTYILQIWHDSGSQNEFTIVLEKTCPSPSNLSAQVTSDTEATLSWDANGATEWELEWGDSNFTQGSGTLVSGITQPSYQLTGLTAGNSYKYYVRSNCGSSSGTSEWAGPYSWDQIVPPANDACATATEIDSLPYQVTQDASGATNNDGFINICSNAMNDGVWFKFTVDQVNGDITVTVTPGTWDPQLDVYEGSDCASLSCVQAADSYGSGHAETITFTPTSGTTYYINVGHYSSYTDGSEGTFTLDVTGDVTLSQENSQFQGFVLYPNPTKGIISWNSNKKVQSVSVMDPSGKELFHVEEPANSIDIRHLASGTYILNVYIQGVRQSFVVIKE